MAALLAIADPLRHESAQALSGLLFPVAAVGSISSPSESVAALRSAWRSSGCILVVLEASPAASYLLPHASSF